MSKTLKNSHNALVHIEGFQTFQEPSGRHCGLRDLNVTNKQTNKQIIFLYM
jgi:hypothetical protein